MEAEDLAGFKKKAQREGRTIVLIDESELTQRPHRTRTWAPQGQPPILHHCFNWKNLSLIAGLMLWQFYFVLFPKTIRAEHLVVFLRHLRCAIPGKQLVIWDGLPAHRSRLVRDWIEEQNGAIATARLPAYAPELNPVEYIWAYLKQHELPNVCAKNFWSLGEAARASLRRMRRRKKLICTFWKQTSLWP